MIGADVVILSRYGIIINWLSTSMATFDWLPILEGKYMTYYQIGCLIFSAICLLFAFISFLIYLLTSQKEPSILKNTHKGAYLAIFLWLAGIPVVCHLQAPNAPARPEGLPWSSVPRNRAPLLAAASRTPADITTPARRLQNPWKKAASPNANSGDRQVSRRLPKRPPRNHSSSLINPRSTTTASAAATSAQRINRPRSS